MRLLTRFSMQNPIVIAILAVLVTVGGILSGRQLQEELMPDISLPIVSVVTSYPGAAPDQVASDVTEPLEKALKGLPGVQTVLSTSTANVSGIEVQLDMDANVQDVEQKIQAAVNKVQLPDGAGQPNVQDFSFDSSPVLYLTVSADQESARQLRDVVNNTIVPALTGVSGVASVSTAGAAPDQVVMTFDSEKLKKYNLTLDQVLQDLQADDTAMPLGAAVIDGKEQPVQLTSSVSSLADLRKLRIPVPANPSAGLNELSKGMQQLGSAVGQVSAGLGQVGQGLGVVQAETELLSSLQSVEGQLFGAEMALNQELQKPADARDSQKIAQLQGQISGLQKTQAQLSAQLQALQKQAHAGQGNTAAASPGTAATPAPTSSGEQSSVQKTVALGTLAKIELKQPDNGSINRTNGRPSVFLGVSKSEDANTVAMAKAVSAELAQLAP
ncbi:efflux RND transporter permease subunit [Alicyclobacillus kakegawensis]|uniref:efflux RND transporter permease subunit n=1 Tax=Alicyclobacillus kakegawensis TaxID=392012 RepID=UPI00082C27EA|nr:efflux RND transporter permease subunit [Alicyclobacillus kakegawensis]